MVTGSGTDGDAHAQADVLEGVLAARYSCRGFLPEEVPAETVQRMFTMAQRTPSWCNSQAWQVDLVGGERITQFAKELTDWVATAPASPDIELPARYEGVYDARRKGAGYALYAAVGVERHDKQGRWSQMLENYRFFGAPHVAVITTPRALGPYGAIDCGAYVATLVTAAQSLGVSTIAQAAIAVYADFVREFLDLPQDRDVVCAVSFGYEDPKHPANAFRTERAEVSEVITPHD